MARERMVTRTVTETVAEIMCLNVVTCEVSISTFTYAGEFSSSEELLKSTIGAIADKLPRWELIFLSNKFYFRTILFLL